ncbi:MAG: hypothetical protein ACE5GQ_00730 [Nitrospinales bacterium]
MDLVMQANLGVRPPPSSSSSLTKMDLFEVHWTNLGFVVVGEGFLQAGTRITAMLGDNEGGGITLHVDDNGVTNTTVDLLAPDPPLEHGTYLLTITKKITGAIDDREKVDAQIAITIGHDEIKHVRFGGEIVDANGNPAPIIFEMADEAFVELVGLCPVGKVVGISCGAATGTVTSFDNMSTDVVLVLENAELDHKTQGGRCLWVSPTDSGSISVAFREGWLLCVGPSLTIPPPPSPVED